MSHVEIWEEPSAKQLGTSALEMLRNLGGPGGVFVRGEDPSRTRVLVTLLHGNEPSGVRAMHAWLLRARRPRASCLWIVGAVEAALEAPGFAHRHLRGRPDLNRCFRAPFEGKDGEIAQEILALVREARPEAVLDLHNNTGHNPPYAISTSADPTRLGLAAWFARRLVCSDLDLGALTEVSDHGAPAVTIECGRAGAPEADRIALAGVDAFLASESIAPAPCPHVEVFEEPTRVELRPGATLAIANSPRHDVALTLAPDVDRHNWRRMEPGATIGWVRDGWPVEALRPSGEDISRELFHIEAGMLRTRQPLIPIMITTDASIAATDCLFYVVRSAEKGIGVVGHS